MTNAGWRRRRTCHRQRETACRVRGVPAVRGTAQSATCAMNQTVTLKIAGPGRSRRQRHDRADDRRGNSQSTTLEESRLRSARRSRELADARGDGRRVRRCVPGERLRGGHCRRAMIRQIRSTNCSQPTIMMPDGPRSRSSRGRTCARGMATEANYRGDAMNARNAFATEKTPEQNRNSTRRPRSDRQGQTSIASTSTAPRLPGRHHRRHRRERTARATTCAVRPSPPTPPLVSNTR